jgi:hypothetical protein
MNFGVQHIPDATACDAEAGQIRDCGASHGFALGVWYPREIRHPVENKY